jgi:hypothetical protein
VAVSPVPGTPFAVALVGVAPTTSGPAIGSLVVGVGSILVSLVVALFAVVGASDGWGPTVAGAFSVLAVLGAGAGLGLGRVGLGQVRRPSHPGGVRGKGLAIAGMSCGATGLAFTVLAFAGAFALASS